MVQIPIEKQQAVRAAAAAAMGGGMATAAPAAACPAPSELAEQFAEIDCPLTGEVVDVTDVDGLIDLYERVKEMGDRLYSVQIRCRTILAGLTEGDAATRRIRGKKRAAKIEMPSESFEQSVLKELWNSHPALAQQYMKIDSLRVQMREFKKLVNTASSEKDFVFFRDALTAANRGRVGTPSVTVEQ